MDYKALYLKYRPQKLSELKGQDAISKTLKNAIKKNQVAHSYLFCGSRGTGKTSTARILARAINCLDLKQGEPCNKCLNCRSALEGKLTDLIEIDAASRRKVEETNELIEKVRFRPNQAKAKVYIIDEVHMLSNHAFNALLKTLEEPPEHAFFILATTEVHKIPNTIISRCQRFDFRRIGQEEIKKTLKEIAKKEKASTAEEEALDLIAKKSNGGLRDAIGALDQVLSEGKVTVKNVLSILGLSSVQKIEELFSFLMEKDVNLALKIISEVVVEGNDIYEFNKEMIAFLREKMLSSVNKDLKELSSILHLIKNFSEAGYNISSAAIPQLPLEIAIIKSCFEFEEGKKKQKNSKELKKDQEKKTEKIVKNKEEVQLEQEKTISKTKDKKDSNTESTTSPEEIKKRENIKVGDLRKNWNLIASKMPTSSQRIAMKVGIPTKIFDGKVLIIFNSGTHQKKIDNPESKKGFQQATKEVFKVSFNMESKLGKLNIEPTDVPLDEEAKEDKTKVNDNIDEVFG